MVTGKKQSLAHLHQAGCKAHALERGILKREKMKERANIRYLLGYSSTNIFFIWIPELKRVIRTRDVKFKDQNYNPLQDNTLEKLIDPKQHILTVEKLDILEEVTEVTEAALDHYASVSAPIFQLEKPLNLTKEFTEEDFIPEKNLIQLRHLRFLDITYMGWIITVKNL